MAWMACSTQRPNGSGSTSPQLSIVIGASEEGSPLTAGQAILVSAPDGSDALLWHGQRLNVDTTNGGLNALGYASTTPYPVTATSSTP